MFLFGVLASLIVYYWDSLWAAIWMHTAWNFSQSIVFGLPNSGIVSKYSVFKLEAASARDGIFYNTSFGVEGSKGANAIMAGIIVAVLLYGLITKRGEKADHWEEMEARDAGKSHIWEAVVLTVIMVAVLVAGILGYRWYNEHAEEIVDRCYLYQKLRRRYRWPAIAVLGNALVFMNSLPDSSRERRNSSRGRKRLQRSSRGRKHLRRSSPADRRLQRSSRGRKRLQRSSLGRNRLRRSSLPGRNNPPGRNSLRRNSCPSRGARSCEAGLTIR